MNRAPGWFFAVVACAWRARAGLHGLAMLAAVLAVGCRGGTDAGESGAPPQAAAPARGTASTRVSPPFAVGDVMRQVHFAYRPDGDGWSGGHDTYSVHATAEGFQVTPASALEAPPAADPARGAPRPGRNVKRGAPAIFELVSAGRTDAPPATPPATPAGAPSVAQDGHLARPRGELVEHLRNSEEGVEQSFSFDRAPAGSGDLTARVRVSGQRYTGDTEHGLHFVDPSTGLGVRYGNAVWVDATGARTPLVTRYEEPDILLTVPGELLARSVYPAVLDPTISPEIGMDTPIASYAANNQQRPNIAFDGQNYMVVWWDNRDIDESDSGYRIYGARVSKAGALLDPGGIIIGVGLNDSNSQGPGIAFNGANYDVAWFSSQNNQWVLKETLVSPAGAVANPQGTQIAVYDNIPTRMEIAAGGGYFLIVWDMDGDIYGQHVNSAGALTGGVLTISSATDNQIEPDVVFGSTVFWVVWADRRNTLNYDIYGARVAPGSFLLDGAGFAISTPAADQRRPSVAYDGTIFMVAWADERWGNADIYATRLSPAAFALDPSGIGITPTITGTQTAPAIAFDGIHYRVAWEDSRTGNSDIYSARVDINGAVLDGTGLPLSQGPAAEQSASIACGLGACLTAWQDQRPGTTWEIFGTRLDPGSAPLDPSGLLISGAAHEQASPSVAFDGTNYMLVWQDRRSGTSWDIYGARMSATGTVLDPSGIAVSTANGDQLTPAIAWNGSGYFIVWEDRRQGAQGEIYGARVGPNGSVSDPSGIGIATGGGVYRYGPALVWNGVDYLVVWTDGSIRGARVTAAGAVQAPSGFLIGTASPDVSAEPNVAFDGTTQLVVWNAYPGGAVLRGGRVTTAGALMDSVSGFTIAASTAGQVKPAIAHDGVNFLVAHSYNGDILGRRVSANATVLDPNGLAISTAAGTQTNPAVTCDGTDCVVAWRDLAASPNAGLFAASVTEPGVVSPPNGYLVSSGLDGNHGMPSLANDNAGHTLLTYARGITASPFGSYRVQARLITSLAAGGACALATDCVSGFCVDGVCCSSACGNGSQTDCLACSVAAGAAVNGTCAPVTGTPCSDGNGCTVGDTCQAGTCAPGAAMTCAALDDCHSPGTCDAATGKCVYTAKANGAPCDDSDPCTQTDTCQAGVCAGSNLTPCPAPDACHADGMCSPATGKCVNPSKPDGAACDDGDKCTNVDTCVAGACVGSQPASCSSPGPCEEELKCNPATGACEGTPKPDGTPCDGGVCQAGTCMPMSSTGSGGAGGGAASGGAGGAAGSGGAGGAGGAAGSGGAGGAGGNGSTGATGGAGTGGAAGKGGEAGTGATGGAGTGGGKAGDGGAGDTVGGCGCRITGEIDGDSPAGGALAGLCLTMAALRRRRRRPS